MSKKFGTFRKLGYFLAAKNAVSKAELGGELNAVVTSAAKSFALALRIKASLIILMIGVPLWFISPIIACAFIAFAVVFVLNVDAAIQFLFFCVFTTLLFFVFGTLTKAILVTMPVWMLYMLYSILKQPPPKQLPHVEINSADIKSENPVEKSQ